VSLESFASDVLGPHQVISDKSWGHGATRVLELRQDSGATWFLKGHSQPDAYGRELAAYRAWVPALGDHAPHLRAADDTLAALLLSAVPGEAGSALGYEPGAQRQAGALLRRLHDGATVPALDLAAAKLAELEGWIARADGLFEPAELDFARASVRGLAGHALVPLPSHGDYTPRNWLLDGERISVIDFEWARPDVWVADLVRLYCGAWREAPALGEAFLDGYGRQLSADDRAVLHACAALTSVFHTVWARAHAETDHEHASRANLHYLRSL
jgi:hypothetical protein